MDAQSGQNGHFSAAILAGGMLLIDRRPALAGLALGLLCYKPQLALLLPFALIGGGYWRTLAATGIGAAALTFASYLLFGAEAWIGFLHQSGFQRALMEDSASFWHRTPTMFAMLRQAGVGVGAAYAAQFLSAALAAIGTALVWRRPGPTEVKAAALLIAIFLATPYAWDYDLVALVFAVAWLARDAARTGFLPWEKLVFALLLLLPLAWLTKDFSPQLGPVVLWAAFGLAVRRALAPTPPLPVSSPGLSAASR
jgi:hypothetical protein